MLHFIKLFDYTGLHCNNVLALQKYCRTANAAKTFTLRHSVIQITQNVLEMNKYK